MVGIDGRRHALHAHLAASALQAVTRAIHVAGTPAPDAFEELVARSLSARGKHVNTAATAIGLVHIVFIGRCAMVLRRFR